MIIVYLTNTLRGYILPVWQNNTPVGYFALLMQSQRKDRIECMGENKERYIESNGASISCPGCHKKATPRQEKELKQLQNRLNRMIGQLSGIGKMLDENRYCGDILTQVAAVESALQSFGYMILKEHMESCVVEEIQKGNIAVVDEAVELIKKLK